MDLKHSTLLLCKMLLPFLVGTLLVVFDTSPLLAQCVTGGFSPQFTNNSLSPAPVGDISLIPVPTAASDDGVTTCVVDVIQTGSPVTNPANPTGCQPFTVSIPYRAEEAIPSNDFMDGTLITTVDPSLCAPVFINGGDMTVQCLSDVPPAPTAEDCVGNALTVNSPTPPTNNGATGNNGDPLIITRTYEASTTCGGSVTITQNITVEDTTPPVANCGDITVQLNSTGTVTVPASDVNDGSTDNCSSTVFSFSLSQSTFGCNDIGPNVVTLTVNDGNGNSDTCPATITVEDNVVPTPVCLNPTIQLDNTGNATITTANIEGGSSDNCAVATTSINMTTFDCTNLGANSVILTVVDVNGNSNTCDATVTVTDNFVPNAICQNFSVDLDANGEATIVPTDIDNGSTDNCGAPSLSLDITDFDCSNLGNNNVTLTATDASGNSHSCPAMVTVNDNIAPTAICMNATLAINEFGFAQVDFPDINNGSSDNCEIVSNTIALGLFDCTNVGTTNNVAVNIMDASGNSDFCTAAITIIDNTNPVAICQNISIQLDAAGNATITTADIDNNSTDNCSVASLALSQTSFDCTDAGQNTVTLTATDPSGNTDDCTATVTVADVTMPNAVCVNTVVQVDLDMNGDATINASSLDGGSTDNCIAGLTFTANPATVDCDDVGTMQVTLTVTDVSGNTDDCNATISVNDNIDPDAICQPLSIDLDPSGNATITAMQVDGGSFDACGIANRALNISTFTCANIGQNNVTLTITDVNTNSDDCVAVVTVNDVTPPTAVCQNASVILDAAGDGSITAADIDNGSSDACGNVTLSVAPMTFDCSNTGTNLVVLTVDDGNGNTDNCTATVTVTDNLPPVAICQNITINIDANGNASINPADIDNGSTDACGPLVLTTDITTLNCSNIGIATTVTLTVTDANGNNDNCTAQVNVIDDTAPVANCQDLTITLDATNNASITPTQIDNGSTDNCGITSRVLSMLNFTCVHLGNNVVTLSLSDAAGNLNSCTANILVEEMTPTIVNCPTTDLTFNTNGSCMPVINFTEPTSTGCNSFLVNANKRDGDTFDQGTTPVTFTFDDGNGNLSDCTFNVIVTDVGTDPILNCGVLENNIIGNTDPGICTGSGFNLMPAMQTDNCGPGNLTLTYDISFGGSSVATGTGIVPPATAFALGTSIVTYTLTDDSGNSDQCDFEVNVIDAEPAMVDCSVYNNLTNVSTNAATCTASGLTIPAVATDNCILATVTYELTGATTATSASMGINDASAETFNLGTTTVTYTVVDENNLSSNCSFDITVVDRTDPIITCATTGLSVNTDPGVCAFTVAGNSLDATATDNCSTITITNNVTNTASIAGATFNSGTNAVTFTATDIAGNTATCTINIVVNDNQVPVANCTDLTISLDAAGDATIAANNVNNGSTDNCAVTTLSLNQTDFVCTDVGANTVTLTVGDAAGNTSTCDAVITVEDNTLPIALCQNASIDLDANGTASLTPAQIDNGSSDACGIAAYVLDIIAFDCSNLGNNTIELTIIDVNNNQTSCNAVVTVNDPIAPVAVCQDIVISLDNNGNASIADDAVNAGSSDNCSIANFSTSPSVFTCANVGINTVTMTVTDAAGNTDNCTADVTISEITDPVAVCQNSTIQLDAAGNASIVAADVNNGSTDNCAVNQIAINVTNFDCNDVGDNNVVLTVTDAAGNSANCTAIITVEDIINPVAVCQNITANLDAAGSVTIAAADINNGSSDVCGIASITLSENNFDCTNIGNQSVVLTVTDSNGNTNDCTAIVSVEDNVNPVANCLDLTIELDASGNVSINAQDLDDNSTDACGIMNYAANMLTFDCSNTGANIIILTVLDNNGNSDDCNAIVTVEDNLAPTAACQDITVSIGSTGTVSITAADIDNGSDDNCAGFTLSVNPNAFDCSDVGVNPVTLTIEDASGNTDNCVANVTINDNSLPTAICTNATVNLDADGNGILSAADVNGGSSATCGTMSLSVSPNTFTCTDLGPVAVVLTVTDNNNNMDNCTATVVIEDNIDPTAICADQTITLNASGMATIVPTDVDGGSTDNCTALTFSLSQTDFDCTDVGVNTVVLTATDGSGNTDNCNVSITVNASAACTLPTIANQGGPSIADPCTCLSNGQFAEEVVVTSNGSGQQWQVVSTTLINPVTNSPFVAGTLLTEQAGTGGSTIYSIEGIHLDGQGYTLTVGSPFFTQELSVSNTCFYPDPVIVTDLSEVICAGDAPLVLEGNAGNAAGTGTFSINGTTVTEINTDDLGSGTFTLVYAFDAGDAGSMNPADPGCIETVSETFTIEATNDNLACNPVVNIVLGVNCEALIMPDEVLEGDMGCLNDYTVELMTAQGVPINNPITANEIGVNVMATVTNTNTNLSCMSQLVISDGVAPTVVCNPISVNCDEPIPAFGTGVNGIDNCDNNPSVIILNEVLNTDDECTDILPNDSVAGFVTLTRTYVAEDAAGQQSAPCEQVITINRPDVVSFPDDLVWSCEQYADNPNIIDLAVLNPAIENAFGTEFPQDANTEAFDLTSMTANDPRLSNNVLGTIPPRPTGSGMVDVAQGAYCKYSVNSTDQVLSMCGFAPSTGSPVFKIIRTFSVLDWCTGEVVETGSQGENNIQVIVVKDVTPPVVTVGDVTLSVNIPVNGNTPASTNGLIPMPIVTDNCTDIESVQGFIYSDAALTNSIALIDANGLINPPVTIGTYFIGFTATDACGNVSIINPNNAGVLTVVDTESPTMVCDEITEVNINSSGLAVVPANVFDDGTYDNACGVIFAARRLTDNCSIPDNLVFNNTVTFCCEDVMQSPVLVEMQATDCNGNSNTCTVQVNVGDNINPVISCPADAAIDCDNYETTLRNDLLACAGDMNCQSQVLTNNGYGDGTLFDNCGASLSPTIAIDIDNCGNGTITRSFTGVDLSGNTSSTCTQTITVTTVSDWGVTFGEDVELTCGATPQNVADSFTEPIIFNETCEMIAISFTDQTFDQVPDACFKVVRYFEIINWCTVGDLIDQEPAAIELSEVALNEDLNGDGILNPRTFRDSYRGVLPTSDNDPDPDNQDGFIVGQQTVKVSDNEAPVFTSDCTVEDVCIIDGTTCAATVTFDIPTVTDCVDATLVTITATSDLGVGFGPFTNVQEGTYTVTFEATDNCGNVAICSNTFAVEDCKLPTPVCKPGLVVELMATTVPDPNFIPMVTIVPSQLNDGSFDACAAPTDPLLLSFSSDITDNTLTFDCDNVGFNNVEMWVTDANGLQDFCTVMVEVQANQNQCDGSTADLALVAGNIATEFADDVENVTVLFNGNAMAADYMTDAAGMYDLSAPMYEDYTIVPSKSDDPLNGVTTFDLVLIKRHILNIQLLDSPYKMIAADANFSESITTLDIVKIKKLILMSEANFSGDVSWRFVDANYVFPDPTNPWLEQFPEFVNINNLETDLMDENFVGVKMGDVNASATANNLMASDDRKNRGIMQLHTTEKSIQKGGLVEIPVYASDFDHYGMQFTLKYKPSALKLREIVHYLTSENDFGDSMIDDGVLTFSWHNARAQKWATDAPLFVLVYDATQSVALSEVLTIDTDYTAAEAYSADGSLQDVQLIFQSESTANGLQVFQNQPNPFQTSTVIGYELGNDQEVSLTVSDISGKVIYRAVQNGAKGYNQFNINREQLATSGVLYYTIATDQHTQTRKMVVVD